MADLINIIKGAGRAAKLDDLVVPARDFIEGQATEGLREIRSLKKSRDAAAPVVARQARALDLRISKLADLQKSLETEFKDALPIEKPGLTQDLAEVKKELAALQKDKAKNSKPVANRDRAANRIAKQNEAQEKFLNKVVERFPDAQVIDLQCLALLRGKEGLPALTLYSPNFPSSTIVTYFGAVKELPTQRRLGWDEEYNYSKCSVKTEYIFGTKRENQSTDEFLTSSSGVLSPAINQPVMNALGRIIKVATGVSVDRNTSRIVLSTQFAEKFKVIPKEARGLIRAAESQGTFDDVLLLAEVPKWNIEYYTQRNGFEFKPKIHGKVVQPPRTEDPLIIGTKKVKDKILAVMLGAFNTTPVEHYARSEFCERIKTPKSRQ